MVQIILQAGFNFYKKLRLVLNIHCVLMLRQEL
jgi:hypothetical protein